MVRLDGNIEKTAPIIVEDEPEEILLSLLVNSTVDTIIQTEIILLGAEMNKYRRQISTQMLASEDETLMQMANLENFCEAFTKGWKAWKSSGEEEAFQVVSTRMLQ